MNSKLISQLCYSEDDYARHSHMHLSCEIIFVRSGMAEFFVDGQHYLANENSIIFINNYEQHEMKILKQPYCRYFAIVHAPELERVLPSSILPGIFKNRPAGFLHCVSLKQFGAEPTRLFEALLRETGSSDAYAETMLKNLLEQLLILVYRACPQNFSGQETNESNADVRVRAIQQYIEAHFTEDLHISDLSEHFFLSRCYLTHIFKERVGYSPQRYIMLNRLSYSKELLENTALQVSQISCQCGFSDANNFIRSFRDWFGMTPNQYRQSCAVCREEQGFS